jgi:hypothetical protein
MHLILLVWGYRYQKKIKRIGEEMDENDEVKVLFLNYYYFQQNYRKYT